MNRLSIKLLSPLAQVPKRSTEGSVGYDLCACLEEPISLLPGETRLIGAGFAMALEPGFAGFLYARSGLGVKHGIVPANCVGVIDSDYRGEIKVGLKNTSNGPYLVNPGDRIAQLVIAQCQLPELSVCETLPETARGERGFGSSGGGFSRLS